MSSGQLLCWMPVVGTCSPTAQTAKPRLCTKASPFLPAASAKTSEKEVTAAIWAGLGENIRDLSSARTDKITAIHITLQTAGAITFASQAVALERLVSTLRGLGQKVQSIETSIDQSRVYVKCLEAHPDTVCWDFVKYGSCPRGMSCRWAHDVLSDFVICINFASDDVAAPVADPLVTCRPKMLEEKSHDQDNAKTNLFFSTVPNEAHLQRNPSEEFVGDASTRSASRWPPSSLLLKDDSATGASCADASTVDGSNHGTSEKADSVDGSRGSRDRSDSADEGSELGPAGSAEDEEEEDDVDAEERSETSWEAQTPPASQAPLRMMNWADYDEDEDDPEMLKKLRVPRPAGTQTLGLPKKNRFRS